MTLGLGGGRKQTPFTRTHDCIYELIRWIAKEREAGPIDARAAEVKLAEIWERQGPIEHDQAGEYKRLALGLVRTLVESGADRQFLAAEPIVLDLAGGRVAVKPDEIAQMPDGTVVLRRIRTGRRSKDEYDGLEYTLYQLAGQKRYGATAQVEAIHLSDSAQEMVSLSASRAVNRRSKTEEHLAAIAAGRYDPAPDAVTCPRCPHFFTCGTLPAGSLTIE